MKMLKVQTLLNKYFAGETSLQEEKALKAYFNSDAVDVSLKSYQPLFQFFKKEKEIESSKSFVAPNLKEVMPSRLQLLRGHLFWRAAAATLVIGVGSFFMLKQFKTKDSHSIAQNERVKVFDEQDDPELALEAVKFALMKVSQKMKKGETQTTEGLLKMKKVLNGK